jgi:hypothetical protein
LTWADDDALYGAYGDGQGFEPFEKEKLSLGLARIEGMPRGLSTARTSGRFRCDPSATVPKGGKRAGLLCVDGVLYL